jgi:predicted nucleotidyltransferase
MADTGEKRFVERHAIVFVLLSSGETRYTLSNEGRPMARNITLPREEIEAFCRKHHVRRLALFGSVLRDDFTPTSDIDVLVEFEPGHVAGFFRLADMEQELSRILDNRKVDIRTPQDLSRYFRDEVVAGAEVQYAQE